MKINISTEADLIVLDNGHHRLRLELDYLWELGHSLAEIAIQKKVKPKKGDTLTLRDPRT